jgi:FMN-dependent NADH-azoreductase
MKLLFVDCCLSQRGESSRTRKLCLAFLQGFAESHPADIVERLDLTALPLSPFNVQMLNERDALADANRFAAPQFALARQFCAADRILVGAPFWDLSFPAQLRIYIEHISVNGLAYCYDAQGPHGTCRAARLAYLTSGGDFEHSESLGILYWRQLCAMYGIPQFDSVFAGGLDAAPGRASKLLTSACAQARALGSAF